MSKFSTLRVRGAKAAGFHLERVARACWEDEIRLAMRKHWKKPRPEIPTHMTRAELTQLWRLAVGVPPRSCALEIGSYLGASSVYLSIGLAEGDGRLLCIDTWQNETMEDGERDTFSEFLSNTEPVSQRIHPIRKRSQDLHTEELPSRVALAFLDGDHSYEAVRPDFQLVAPVITTGGVLAFHDAVEFSGVTRTIGEALASGNWQPVGHVDNLMWLRKQAPSK